MGFDLNNLRAAVHAHGRVTRVVIADIKGSSPREVGAAMLVWETGQSGTIGGGALEFEATQRARRQTRDSVLSRHALGPELGQCCGGAVTLVSEVYDADRVETLDAELIVRHASGPTEQPLALRKVLKAARNANQPPEPQLISGWMVEPVHTPAYPLWIWGAGHVGRALVDVLAPMPDFDITWIDTGADRFPAAIPADVTSLPAADPASLVRHAPENAKHLILTYSHELDLGLCHALLSHRFGFAGVIGSASKWARFRSRLTALGHTPGQIDRLTCPIGDPALGKHPQAIAVGVATQLLRHAAAIETGKERRA
jgi:xanthine dehydrogenase accessory factor